MKQQWEKQPPLKRVLTICLKIAGQKMDFDDGAIKIGEAIDELLADQQAKDIEKLEGEIKSNLSRTHVASSEPLRNFLKRRYKKEGFNQGIRQAISTLKGEE